MRACVCVYVCSWKCEQRGGIEGKGRREIPGHCIVVSAYVTVLIGIMKQLKPYFHRKAQLFSLVANMKHVIS